MKLETGLFAGRLQPYEKTVSLKVILRMRSMKKQFRLAVYWALCLLVWPLTAFAAPLAKTEAVNLPGWLGGFLAILALLMPIIFRLWAKQQK